MIASHLPLPVTFKTHSPVIVVKYLLPLFSMQLLPFLRAVRLNNVSLGPLSWRKTQSGVLGDKHFETVFELREMRYQEMGTIAEGGAFQFVIIIVCSAFRIVEPYFCREQWIFNC